MRAAAGYPVRSFVRPKLTALMRRTEATVHMPHGESVMSDEPRELRRHLPIVLHAHGRVLVTGLGLGCVVRGLVANERVEHVDVLEVDWDVIALVGPSLMGVPKVTLHQGDARTHEWPEGTRWDYAWHDLWCEHGSLDLLHAEVLARYDGMAGWQGAWQLPREVKRCWPRPLLGQASRWQRARAR